MRKLFAYIILIFSFLSVKADFVINSRLLEAQNFINKLQLEKGRTLIELEKKENPINSASIFFENYIDLYSILTSQSVLVYNKLLPNRDIRLNLMSQKKSASPYYLYCQADIHLQWAFAKSQHGDYLSAALDFRAAYQLLQKNTILYPNFIYNNKDLGILKVILGTIPDGYKWIANIAGLSGNFEEGMSLMKNFIAQSANNQLLPVENQSARLLYCLLLINFDKDKLSNWSLTDKFTNDYQTNLMTNCVRAFVASKCDMADEGIKNLLDKPHTKDYVSFYYTDYLLGSMKLNRLDEDASMYLKRFVSLCPNKSLYQETYTKLAWSYIVKGDTNNYYLYAGLSNKYSENEKKWLIISSQGDENKLPNISLLKTRLFTDGGYYYKAEQEILSHGVKKNYSDLERTEYYYRLARIYHGINNYQKAIENYNFVIKMEGQLQVYIIPNSHLQLAIIYEKLNYNSLALTHYKNALKYNNYQYRYGIEQKAKAGISMLQKHEK